MTTEEKGLICLFALFVSTSILHIASDIYLMLGEPDPYNRLNRGASSAQTFLLFIMICSGAIYVANCLDKQAAKLSNSLAWNNRRYFGGQGRRLGVVVDDRQQEEKEGQEDQQQIEGQPRQARRG